MFKKIQFGRMRASVATVVATLMAAVILAGVATAGPVPRAAVKAALPQIEAMAHKIIADGGVPGLAIAIVHDDELVYLQGFGLREMGRSETIDGDTVFPLASLSKPISATVVAALVSQGLLDWKTRIADLDPSFALHDPYPTAEVTVRDLLNHRSGLPGTAGDDLENIGYGRDEVMHRLRLVPPWTSFRAGYSYSNAGFTAGAVAAARTTGKDWETAAEEYLFKPAGMVATSFRYDVFQQRDNVAAMHIMTDGTWSTGVAYDPVAQAPAGAATSSARDLARWMRLVLGHGVLDGKSLIDGAALDATHEPLMARGCNPVSGAASFYGLGWNVELGRHGLLWGHAGAFSYGTRTAVGLLPDSDLGIVVLANAFPSGAPEALIDSFFDLALDGHIAQDYLTPWDALYVRLFGPAIAAAKATFATPPKPATPALPNVTYAGRYANAYVGEATVSEEDGVLFLVLGPDGARRFPLRHFDRDLFIYFPEPEMPDKPSALRFVVGPNGRTTALTAESVDANGLGTLARVGD